MMAAAGGGDNGGAGVADCVEDTVVFGCCCCCWCWPRMSACRFLRGPYLGGSELMVVDTGRWVEVEVESPACEREGKNRLTAVAQDRLCSGVSRSLAVSATDLGVMGGHHRQQRCSSALPQRGGPSLEGEVVSLKLHLLLQSPCVLLVLSLSPPFLDDPQASGTLGNLLWNLCVVSGCRRRQPGT